MGRPNGRRSLTLAPDALTCSPTVPGKLRSQALPIGQAEVYNVSKDRLLSPTLSSKGREGEFPSTTVKTEPLQHTSRVTRMSGRVARCLFALVLAPLPVAAGTQPPPDAHQHWAFHPP